MIEITFTYYNLHRICSLLNHCIDNICTVNGMDKHWQPRSRIVNQSYYVSILLGKVNIYEIWHTLNR